jgi:hypothetical protein
VIEEQEGESETLRQEIGEKDQLISDYEKALNDSH